MIEQILKSFFYTKTVEKKTKYFLLFFYILSYRSMFYASNITLKEILLTLL